MANFFLIDQSLRDAGGHHCDYVQCVARAANQMGFLTTIGTNRRLPKKSADPLENLNCLGLVRRVFNHTVYHRDSHLAGLRRMKNGQIPMGMPQTRPGFLKNLRHRIEIFQHRRRREKVVRQFAKDCEIFFRNTLFTPQDHAFFATASELELMGLAVFLSKHPRATQARWHMQFHFNLFEGRPPEYARQSSTVKAVRSCFLAALSRLSYFSVNFYTTSQELAEQYNHLGVGEFFPLPYPIAHEFAPVPSIFDSSPVAATLLNFAQQQKKQQQPGAADSFSTESTAYFSDPTEFTRRPMFKTPKPNHNSISGSDSFFGDTPIRVTCPGGIRREKGHAEYLQPLVDEIYAPLLATGQVQLVLQRPPRKLLHPEKLELQVPKFPVGSSDCDPIVYVTHPLARAKYHELIRTTDIGLLFYDSQIYYSRRAGVLGELLSAGKPIIVPAGCWLAEQIQEPIFRHADQQFVDREFRRTVLADLRWESQNVPMPGGTLSFDDGRRPFRFEMDVLPTETLVGLRFDWHWPNEPGVYCRIELTQVDAAGEILEKSCQVVGHRQSNKPNVLMNLAAGAATLKFSLKNAFHHSTASVKNVEILTTRGLGVSTESRRTPQGAVGVIAADHEHLASSLKEILDHLEHYRRTAEEFSHPWYTRHDPSRTVAHLISSELYVTDVA